MIDPISQRLFAAGPPSPICLMYHATPLADALSKWDVPIATFKLQLKLLKANGWVTRPISDITQHTPPKTVFITFDDGYANNYAAFDALINNDCTATWFIVANTIGKTSAWEENEQTQRTMLNTEQIQHIANSGIEIGSHTSSHAKLTQLTCDKYIDELKKSKVTLENITKQPVTSFSYPYGLYNQTIRDSAEKIGYQQACTTHSGFSFIDDDALQIRRVAIYSHDSLSTFARKLVFGDNEAGWGKTSSYLGRRLFSKFCERITS